MTERRLSFVIPARNEEALIGEVLMALLASVARASAVSRDKLWVPDTAFEVVVVDDGSNDGTAAIVGRFADEVGVRMVACAGGTCAVARNVGTAATSGQVLCFVDADTIVPEDAVHRILQLHEDEGRSLVLYRLASREPGIRAWLWWSFWGLARRLPLARAKSMPAFMSCDRAHFDPLRPLRRVVHDRRGMAADRRVVPPRTLPLRPDADCAHFEPSDGASALRLRPHVPRLVVGCDLPVGAHDAHPSDSTPNKQSMIRELAESAWYSLSLALGRALRAAKYSETRVVHEGPEREVRKHRAFYAPPLVWMGGALVRILNTGVTVLSQRDWEERERRLYRTLHGASIRIDSAGVLVLPGLPGRTLAALLEDAQLSTSFRKCAIESAVVALHAFHQQGLTHGDAMAENVMVDLDAKAADWFDFETVHDSSRSMSWRRADDVRALLAACLLRTAPERFAETIDVFLDAYADDEVGKLMAASFASVWRRALIFHLGQAALSVDDYCEINRLLTERFSN